MEEHLLFNRTLECIALTGHVFCTYLLILKKDIFENCSIIKLLKKRTFLLIDLLTVKI